MVLVIEQMELIEGRSGYLPMRFLVEIAQGHSVCQKRVELLGHLQTNGFFQFKRQLMAYGSITLEFSRMLMKAGLCIDCPGGVPWILFLIHCFSLFLAMCPGIPAFVTVDCGSACSWQPCLLRCSRFLQTIYVVLWENGQNGSATGRLFWDSRVAYIIRRATMSNQNDRPQPVQLKTPVEIEKLADQRRLDEVANKAAEQARITERRYDEANDIFTK
jgi:hypothetical protein